MLAINGVSDHIHFLIGMKSSCRHSDLVREIKKSTNDLITENKLSEHKFSWQEGYGAFSYGHSQLDTVIKYIMNQKEHHKKKSFREEYMAFLKKFDIPYDERYIFDWAE
jgi:REP element-mobilizing transposase RayT